MCVLPRLRLGVAIIIMNDRGVPIRAFERPTDETPERPRNRRTVHCPAARCGPDLVLRIAETIIVEQFQLSTVIQELDVQLIKKSAELLSMRRQTPAERTKSNEK